MTGWDGSDRRGANETRQLRELFAQEDGGVLGWNYLTLAYENIVGAITPGAIALVQHCAARLVFNCIHPEYGVRSSHEPEGTKGCAGSPKGGGCVKEDPIRASPPDDDATPAIAALGARGGGSAKPPIAGGCHAGAAR